MGAGPVVVLVTADSPAIAIPVMLVGASSPIIAGGVAAAFSMGLKAAWAPRASHPKKCGETNASVMSLTRHHK